MNEPPPSTEVTAPAKPQIRNVTRANARQLRILRAAFQTTFATPKVLTELEEQTGLPSKWISAWFNRERRKVSKLQAAATAVKLEHAENLQPSSEVPTTRPNEEDRQAKKQKTTLMTTARLSSPQHRNRLADSGAALVDIKKEQAENYHGYMLFPPIKEVIVVDAPPAVTHLRKPTAVAAPRKSVLMSTSAHNTPNTRRPPAETDKDDTISIALDPAGDHNHENQPWPAQTCADDMLAVPSPSDLPLRPIPAACLPAHIVHEANLPLTEAPLPSALPLQSMPLSSLPPEANVSFTEPPGLASSYLDPQMSESPATCTMEDTLDMTKAPLKYLSTIHPILHVYQEITDQPFHLFGDNGRTTTIGLLVVDRLTDPSLVDTDPFQASMGLVFLSRLGLSV